MDDLCCDESSLLTAIELWVSDVEVVEAAFNESSIEWEGLWIADGEWDNMSWETCRCSIVEMTEKQLSGGV